MKAKRLIEILQSIVEEQGDVEVYVPKMGTSYDKLDALYFYSGIAYMARESQRDSWRGLGFPTRRYGVAPIVITKQYEDIS